MVGNTADFTIYNFFQAITITVGLIGFIQLLKGITGLDISKMLLSYLTAAGSALITGAIKGAVSLI